MVDEEVKDVGEENEMSEEGTKELVPTEEEAMTAEERLEEVKAQAAEYLDGWQRARAEFANYKKRQEELSGQVREDVKAGIFMDMLPVLDDIELAFANVPEGLEGESWLDGFVMIRRKLETTLEKNGVRAIDNDGHFDPNLHEAITSEEAEGFSEGQIIEVVRRGYMLGERVLRPALVRVAK